MEVIKCKKWRSEVKLEGNSSGRKPSMAGDESPDGELRGHISGCNGMKTRPSDSKPGGGSGPKVTILPIIQRILSKSSTLPRQPTHWAHQAINIASHDDGPRVLLPGPPQVRLHRPNHGLQISRRPYLRVVDRDSAVLKWVLSALRGDHVHLPL